MKHTPGPWRINQLKYDNGTVGYFVEAFEKPITGWGAVTTSEANARVMAAALDLLEAAEAAIGVIEAWNEGKTVQFGPTFEKLVAAADKAKGR